MAIDSFRKKTGLTIRELADLIGVSHGSISHKEKGRRAFFPSKGDKKMDQLERAWKECCAGKAKVVIDKSATRNQQQAYLLKQLKKHSDTAAFDLLHLMRSLEAMRERYRKLEAKLLFIQLLRKDNKDESRDIVFRFREHELAKAMDFCSPEKQQLLAFRLKLARATEKLANDALKELSESHSEGK